MEERLERKNLFGAADLTPFNAVQVMSGKEIKYRYPDTQRAWKRKRKGPFWLREGGGDYDRQTQ